jgi:hypothetical protein
MRWIAASPEHIGRPWLAPRGECSRERNSLKLAHVDVREKRPRLCGLLSVSMDRAFLDQ